MSGDLDLPLEESGLSRILVWTTAGLIFLAVLAFAAAAIADIAIKKVERSPILVTVALPPIEDAERARTETLGVLTALRSYEGVAFALPVSSEELGELMAPLLEEGQEVGLTSMPRLIDVTFNPGRMPDLEDLYETLSDIAPSISIGDSDIGIETDTRTSSAVRLIGLASGTGFLLLVIIVAIVVTRMSLNLHDSEVDLLRLMGAADRYVARQFEHHIMEGGLRGSVYGFGGAILALLILIYGHEYLGFERWTDVQLRPLDWILLAMVPVIAALLMTLAARFTAMNGLFHDR